MLKEYSQRFSTPDPSKNTFNEPATFHLRGRLGLEKITSSIVLLNGRPVGDDFRPAPCTTHQDFYYQSPYL
jgi:hypothetical protein